MDCRHPLWAIPWEVMEPWLLASATLINMQPFQHLRPLLTLQRCAQSDPLQSLMDWQEDPLVLQFYAGPMMYRLLKLQPGTHVQEAYVNTACVMLFGSVSGKRGGGGPLGKMIL